MVFVAKFMMCSVAWRPSRYTPAGWRRNDGEMAVKRGKGAVQGGGGEGGTQSCPTRRKVTH